MPPSTGSPDLRARTNTASTCWRAEIGNDPALCIVIVAQPSAPVAVSGGIENCWNGIASARTMAPCTEWPAHAETWKRTVMSELEREIGDWSTCCPSISSSAGFVTLATGSGLVGFTGQPFTLVGGGAEALVTTAVGSDVACAVPSPFFAVTRTRIVSFTSPLFSRYV